MDSHLPNNIQVLVLEDSPSAMLDLVSKLRRFVHQDRIFRAFNYKQATDAMNTTDFSVIFSDLSMPKKNGMDFIVDFLSSNDTYRDIPVIVTTGVSTGSFLRKALNGKVYRYLEKPVKIEELEEAFSSIYQSQD